MATFCVRATILSESESNVRAMRVTKINPVLMRV